MNNTYIILENYLKRKCLKEYLLEDKVMDEYRDIELKTNQTAIVYELYHEIEGGSYISRNDEVLLESNSKTANKNSYEDVLEQVKVFITNISTVVEGSFTFSGSGMSPHIKYLLITNLDN